MFRKLFVCAAAACAAWPVVAPAQDEPPVFRAGVDVVTVPVRVLDSDGKPVEGLGAADFTVRVDDAPRKVASVEAVRTERTVTQEAPVQQTRSYSSNASAPAGGAARTVLLIVDVSGFEMTEARQVATQIGELLDQLPPEDLVGLVAIPVGTPAVDPTADREKVRAALRNLTGGATPPTSRYQISPGEAIAIQEEGLERGGAAGPRPVFDMVVERECFGEFRGSPCPQHVEREALVRARFIRDNVRLALRAFTNITNALPASPELKHLVLITGGLFHENGLETHYRDAGANLAGKTATLSIIQIEGLAGSAESRLEAGGPDDRLLTRGLQLLAGATGADLLRLGTLTTRFQRFSRELDAYYLVAISAEPQDLDGRRHQLEIAVAGRQVTVQHPPRLVRAASAVPPDPKERLAGVMQRLGVERGLPVAVQTTTMRGEDPTRLHVIVVARVNQEDAADAAVGLQVHDGQKIVTAQTGTLDPANRAAGVPAYVSSVLVPPGRYRLRVGVVDRQGRAGSVDHEFTADLPAAGPVLTSGLVVGQAAAGPMRPALDLTQALPIAAVLELYTIDPSARRKPEVELTLASVEDPNVSRRVKAKVEGTEVEGIQRAVATMDAKGLPPGEYLVRAEVKAGDAVTAVDRHVTLHAGEAAAAAATPGETVPAATPAADVPPLVRRASDYVEQYLRTLSEVVMTESSRQHLRGGIDIGNRATGSLNVRRLDSELLFVSLPPPAGPTAFRDVLAVDGRPVRDRDDRLRRLFVEQHPSAVQQATQIMVEGARHNLGTAARILNVPTVPLIFLRSENLTRLRYELKGEREVDGRTFARVAFNNELPPTVLQTAGGEQIFAQGEFLIDPQDGSVRRADLSINIREGSRRSGRILLEGDTTVEFKPHDEWGFMVPASMKERYVLRGGEEFSAETSYTGYQRFGVATEEKVAEPE